MKIKTLVSSMALLTLSSAITLATPALSMQANPTLSYSQKIGGFDQGLDFKFEKPTALVTGLVNINKMLSQLNYPLTLIVPAGSPSSFMDGITAQIKTISGGNIDQNTSDAYNQSTYAALVISMPQGFGDVMDHKDIYLVHKLPKGDIQLVNGKGLLNAYAYMSGRASQAPSLSITTLEGLSLVDSTTTNINNPSADVLGAVGNTLNAADYNTLTTHQSNKDSTTLFYQTINPTSAWWDNYYTTDTDPTTGKAIFQGNDEVFSDWKANVSNWYPTEPTDAYVVVAFPYNSANSSQTFQLSFLSVGSGFGPDVSQSFAGAFPNRPIYSGIPNATYDGSNPNWPHADRPKDWWSQLLSDTRRAPVLSNDANMQHGNTVNLDDAWDSNQTLDKKNHAVITIADQLGDSNHIQINNANNPYMLHNGWDYAFIVDVSAVDSKGSPVALSSDDTDIPSLVYDYSNGKNGASGGNFENGQLTLNFTAHCEPGLNGETQDYCSAVYGVYHENSSLGRTYTISNPKIKSVGQNSGLPFWLDTPQDQHWNGNKIFYANFNGLKDCKNSDDTCIASNKAIESTMREGFSTMDKNWGDNLGGSGVLPQNVKLIPSDSNSVGHVALVQDNAPTVEAQYMESNINSVQQDCAYIQDSKKKAMCVAQETLYATWFENAVIPLQDGTKSSAIFTLESQLTNASMSLHSQDLFDLDAYYAVPADQQASLCLPNAPAICKVRPSSWPSYCGVDGSQCNFYTLNTSDPTLAKAVGELNLRSGGGLVARHRAASGRYMMCVKMPQQTGASFSSWLFSYQDFLQGDLSWLHQAGAKRNSEMDFMESSYINDESQPIQASEADFGSYGGMISNAGSAEYRDYYNVGSQDQYVWMGYDYHTGNASNSDYKYAGSDTAQLANTNTIGGAGSNFDSAQNSRTGSAGYVDMYVDSSVDCSSENLNGSRENFDTIWNKHIATGHKVIGESQADQSEPAHTILGDTQGLGWLPYRYMRWTVALWNPSNGNTPVDGQASYIGWAGTPLGSYVDLDAAGNPIVKSMEADVSYLAMNPNSSRDNRDKIENETGSPYWSTQYDDSALNMQSAPSFSCDGGSIHSIEHIDGSNMIASAFKNATGGVQVTFGQGGVAAKAALDTATGNWDVCVPNGQDFANIWITLKPNADSASTAPAQCYSNNSSAPVAALLTMHGDDNNGYVDCKFSGTN